MPREKLCQVSPQRAPAQHWVSLAKAGSCYTRMAQLPVRQNAGASQESASPDSSLSLFVHDDEEQEEEEEIGSHRPEACYVD